MDEPVACPHCSHSVPKSNICIHEVRCAPGRAAKRQKVADEGDLTAAIALSLAQPCPAPPVAAAAEDPPPRQEDQVDVTRANWDTEAWIWARRPGKLFVRDHEQDEEAEAIVVRAYERGKEHSSVHSGALGSRELFDVCNFALDAFPGASTSGKWMLFVNANHINHMWSLIRDGVHAGRLGHVAKTGPVNGERTRFLICVYTSDFRDMQDVGRVYKELLSILKDHQLDVDCTAACDPYKADIVTTAFFNEYFTSSINNGTFYSGHRSTGEVTYPDHFSKNNNKGAKVSVVLPKAAQI